MTPEEKFEELQDELWCMDYSKASVRKANEIFKLAESMNNLELMFEAQEEVMDHANFTGEIEMFMNAFAWCRAMIDKNPGMFSSYDIIWKYKWAIDHALEFPQIPLSKVDEMFEDLKKRSNATEKSRSIATLRMTMWRYCNELEKLETAVENFQKSHGDYNSDCSACLADLELQALLALGRNDEAMENASKIIDGRMSCAEIPHYTYGNVLSCLHKRDPEKAVKYHKKGYQMVKGNTLSFIHNHLDYLAESGQETAALDLFEKQVHKFTGSTPFYRLKFGLAALALFKLLLNGETNEVSLNLPQDLKDLETDGKYKVTHLRNWFKEKVEALAKAFDERNGNSGHSELLSTLV